MAPFRRMAAACAVVCLCLTAGAWGATGNGAQSAKQHPSKSRHHTVSHSKAKGKRRPKKAKKHQPTAQLTSVSATAAPSVTTASPMLFGDKTVESLVDDNKAGMAEAFPFTATTGGQALTLSVYVDSHNKATKLIAGVYSDASGHPGALLASGSASSPQSGGWDTVSLPSTGVTFGQSYWVAILGTGGAPYFRDRDSGPCQSVTSAQTSLTGLPSTWKSGSAWQTCPVSMYVGGTAAKVSTSSPDGGTTTTTGGSVPVPPLPAPPINILPPTVSGTTTQGNTLTTSNGSWSGSPTGYTYAWQDCNSSGASCSAISGATSSSYALQASDVGHTIRSVVTASNSGGSASASSAQTAVAAAPPPAAPANTAAPAVTGSPSQGSTLTTSNGSWSGRPTSYTYAWQDCDTSGANCATISGATSSSYTLGAGDVGSTIRSLVTAKNAGGSASASSAVTAVVTGSGSGGGGGGGSTSCDLNATTSTFSSQVSAASAGQTICLASGNYGTWGGTNKAITVAAAPNASPTMQVSFGSGDSGFTLSGMGGMGGEIDSGAKNITIENSAFTDTIVFNGVSNANLMLNADTFLNINNPGCTGEPARIHLYNSSGQTGVTVENSLFSGGDTDGIQSGAPLTILNNVFTNLRSSSSDCNHTDSIQLYGGYNVVAAGNLFYNDYDGLVAFDGTSGNTITDNACYDIDRGSCITLYSDDGSVVNHNTAGPGMTLLEIDRKSSDPAGKNTVYENNVGDANVSDGSTLATDTNNLYSGARSPDISGSPSFAGGSAPTTWAGYELKSTSSGHTGATDGADVGIRGSAAGPPSALQ